MHPALKVLLVLGLLGIVGLGSYYAWSKWHVDSEGGIPKKSLFIKTFDNSTGEQVESEIFVFGDGQEITTKTIEDGFTKVEVLENSSVMIFSLTDKYPSQAYNNSQIYVSEDLNIDFDLLAEGQLNHTISIDRDIGEIEITLQREGYVKLSKACVRWSEGFLNVNSDYRIVYPPSRLEYKVDRCWDLSDLFLETKVLAFSYREYDFANDTLTFYVLDEVITKDTVLDGKNFIEEFEGEDVGIKDYKITIDNFL